MRILLVALVPLLAACQPVVVEGGEACEEYCTAVMDSCAGENQQYASEQACLDYCRFHGQIEEGDLEDADQRAGSDTLACRINHAALAESTPAVHCPHSGPTGDRVCGSLCENYCRLASINCPDLFDAEVQCMNECMVIADDGQSGDEDTDTVQCRIFWMGRAGIERADNAAECLAAAPDSLECVVATSVR